MRLSPDQLRFIRKTTAEIFGTQARARVFGSRLDDHAMGGDIDLLVEAPEEPSLKKVLRAQAALEHGLQEPVDLIAAQTNSQASPIVNIARLTGELL